MSLVVIADAPGTHWNRPTGTVDPLEQLQPVTTSQAVWWDMSTRLQETFSNIDFFPRPLLLTLVPEVFLDFSVHRFTALSSQAEKNQE